MDFFSTKYPTVHYPWKLESPILDLILQLIVFKKKYKNDGGLNIHIEKVIFKNLPRFLFYSANFQVKELSGCNH